jgi:CheY-like chemotaxis protein
MSPTWNSQEGLTPPGIVLSGHGQNQDIKQSREAGFAAHLVKSLDRRQLREVIAELIG